MSTQQFQPRLRFERAAQLFAWTDAMRDKIGDHRRPVEKASVERDLEVIHSKLKDTESASLFAEGRAMTIEQSYPICVRGRKRKQGFSQG